MHTVTAQRDTETAIGVETMAVLELSVVHAPLYLEATSLAGVDINTVQSGALHSLGSARKRGPGPARPTGQVDDVHDAQ